MSFQQYGSGIPFCRLEQLETQLGIALPTATQWEVVDEAAELIKPAHEELIRQAAQGEVLHNDDTSMRVLHLERDPSDERTGVHPFDCPWPEDPHLPAMRRQLR